MAIPTIYKFGIEIKKPWTSEMYEFNENIRTYYQDQILDLIETLDTPERCQLIAGIINPYGYGQGLATDIKYMQDDMRGNIQTASNHWIKECVDDKFGFSRYAERLGRSANSFDEQIVKRKRRHRAHHKERAFGIVGEIGE